MEYAKIPSDDEIQEILKPVKSKFEKINFSHTKVSFTNIDLKDWIKEFNNRVNDFQVNYVFVMAYYNEGIPDDNWKAKTDINKEQIRFFPEFADKDFAINYWFGFYVDSLFARYLGLVDAIYHILNCYYKLNIHDGMGYNLEVIERIKSKNKKLSDYLASIIKDRRFKRTNANRQSQIHNFRKNQIHYTISRTKKNGVIRKNIKLERYKTSAEFVKDINDSIGLLSEIVCNVKKEIGDIQ
ncbi:Cthe_2314 family HEPN domain-containing protein [Clostridium beijerinckii]|uniref:Cthe_2314 family HEPN domain-containing protein n=1 Tax=Clostridium beijerinckii TaxID=1520 RepID=UPI001A9A618F|nr:Cthe_2314 family HEPN domain-containing protein [Clostridium beijerinckii]